METSRFSQSGASASGPKAGAEPTPGTAKAAAIFLFCRCHQATVVKRSVTPFTEAFWEGSGAEVDGRRENGQWTLDGSVSNYKKKKKLKRGCGGGVGLGGGGGAEPLLLLRPAGALRLKIVVKAQPYEMCECECVIFFFFL